MPAQQRIKLVFHAIQWVMFAETEAIQRSIDRCKALVYQFVREARDAETARLQANFRNLAKAQLTRMHRLEKQRINLLVHAAGGMLACVILVIWLVLALIL
jgi:hypothetical protein